MDKDFPRLSIFVLVVFSKFCRLWASSDDLSGCPLNFTAYPFLPSGECIRDPAVTINLWDSFHTTTCCKTGLTTISQALALNANMTDSIFLTQKQWQNCSSNNSLFERQQSVSITTCGFDKLFYGSSGCSSFSYSTFKKSHPRLYENLIGNCTSQFSTSFNNTCKDCAKAITDTRDELMDLTNVNDKKNGTAKEICVFLVVVAAAVEHIGDSSWINDFYSCLLALDSADEGYSGLKYSTAQAILAILIAASALVLIIVVIKYVTRKRVPRPVKGKEMAAWSGLYRFSKQEILNAINFSSHKVCLGTGSAGQVYKAVLPSGQIVAIKHIYKSNTSDTFTREVEGLSRIRHPNLVCLFGCCEEDGEQYLVYEFCSNGNLAQHLLRRNTDLTWDRRVKIMRDCAIALKFLHNNPYGCTVHRDIKLTNILLTDTMDPKLSDFGLARMLGMEESKVFTDVRGTLGYMDPEYMSNAKLTSASDVYSFGIVILQILSGRKVIELDIDARDQLTRKAKDVIMAKRPATEFEDPRLKGDLDAKDFRSILHIAVLCVANKSNGRPTIDNILQEIDDAWKNTQTFKIWMASLFSTIAGIWYMVYEKCHGV
ncbi:proline-rich receptor-like protein kinase PERK3 [Papaver somniferum]|uniref:proline-rich receptor-like protein kinase PERK3 n=1 Tax=Papaver somniferum TaxID=3469 RepID=UPI000E6FD4E9|nr:proline-rich receptor-like protein kinase PERK3 [Papaver somniferum]